MLGPTPFAKNANFRGPAQNVHPLVSAADVISQNEALSGIYGTS